MTIYIPLGIIGIILTAVFIARSKQSQNRLLEKQLEAIQNKDEYIVNVFNRSDSRSSTLKQDIEKLVLSTDLQVLQIASNGKVKFRISSEMEGKDVKFEGVIKFNPETVLPSLENPVEETEKIIVFPFRDEKTMELLYILFNDYGIGVERLKMLDCIAIPYEHIDVNLSRKTIEVKGKFNNENWVLSMDYDRFRIKMEAALEDLQDLSNFKKYYIDYL